MPFGDLAVSRPLGPTSQTFLTAVPAVRGVAPVNLIDVTDPAHPIKTGQASNFVVPKRVLVRPNTLVTVRKLPSGLPVPIPACSDHIPLGTKFNGDLAVVSSSTTSAAHISFFDVTDPAKPCALGGKIVSANPEQLGPTTQHGTFRGVGVSRGVATIEHTTGVAAYMAVTELGVVAVDVGNNLPEVDYTVRQSEGLYSGDYRDVAAIGSRLFAANNAFDAPASLDVFDPNLSFITSVGLNVKPRRLIAAEAVRVDRNADGQISSDEIFDLLFAAGIGGIDILDVTDPDNPMLIGHVNHPGIIRELAVANGGRRLLAGGDRGTVAGEGFFIFDVADPFSSRTDRKLYELAYPDGIGGMESDDARGLAYIAHARGIDVLSVDPPNLSGVIKYESYDAVKNLGLDYAHKKNLPVRGAVVELRDSTDTVIASTNTNDAGYYSFAAPRNSALTIAVKAALGDPKHPRVEVRDNENNICLIHSTDPDCNLYRVDIPVLLGAVPVTKDFTIQSGWDGAHYSGRRDAAPFSILDTIRDAEKFVSVSVGPVSLPPLRVFWSRINHSGDVGFR